MTFLRSFLLTVGIGGLMMGVLLAQPVSSRPVDGFPQFIVPGQDREMSALNAMHRLHFPPVWLDYPNKDPEAGLCTLWDEWLTGPCLWADTAGQTVCDGKVTITRRLRNAFLNKIIDSEGYVATHQHEGIGHVLGWPFPYWINNVGAAGIHFSDRGTKSSVLRKGAPVTTDPVGWSLQGLEPMEIDSQGWRLNVTGPDASMTTPEMNFETFQSPFIQVRWTGKNLGDAEPFPRMGGGRSVRLCGDTTHGFASTGSLRRRGRLRDGPRVPTSGMERPNCTSAVTLRE